MPTTHITPEQKQAQQRAALAKLEAGQVPSQFVGKRGGIHYKTLNSWLSDPAFAEKWYDLLSKPKTPVPPASPTPNYLAYGFDKIAGKNTMCWFDTLYEAEIHAKRLVRETGNPARVYTARIEYLLVDVPTVTEKKIITF